MTLTAGTQFGSYEVVERHEHHSHGHSPARIVVIEHWLEEVKERVPTE